MIDLLKRDPPGPYIQKAIKIYREIGSPGSVVELGTMRGRLKHPLLETHHECCLDGHSTMHFAKEGFEDFWSVDIDPEHVQISKQNVNGWSDWRKIVCMDGIKFIKEFPGKIGFLFLDAWDADLPNTADKHAEALFAALPKMTEHSLVLIDDTDVEYDPVHNCFNEPVGWGGKGKTAIPLAIANGYEVVFSGRQTLLRK